MYDNLPAIAEQDRDYDAHAARPPTAQPRFFNFPYLAAAAAVPYFGRRHRGPRLRRMKRCSRGRLHSIQLNMRSTPMTEQSRLRKIAWAIAPIWLSKFDQWCARRASARQKYQRELDHMANPEPMREPEPRERPTVDSIWQRMTADRRPQWYDTADELRRERDALHHRIGGRHHGATCAADNYLTRRDRKF
jgi:hypothetical protein